MRNAITGFAACLIFCASLPAQEHQPAFSGAGHLLGETAEQFYSEGYVGDVLRACQAGDRKTVSRLFKDVAHSSQDSAKNICRRETFAEKEATSGARLEFKSAANREAMRADTFTFDGGQLVKIDMVYRAPIAVFEGQHPQFFGEILAGLHEAYGEPTKTYTRPVLNSYGVEHDAHAAMWVRQNDVIMIFQQLGLDAWTEIVAQSLEEYKRAANVPQFANPLQ